MPDNSKKPTPEEIRRSADVNLAALKMKKYHDGDMKKVQHFVRVYTLAKKHRRARAPQRRGAVRSGACGGSA